MNKFLLIACLSFFTLGLSAQVVFVDADATGTGDGSSWANASTDLNVALRTAPSGASVWIADGTYTTPDTVSFSIDKELTVLGGFNGTETSADEADPVANVTILSGDFMGNDVAGTYDSLAYADNNRVLLISDTSAMSGQYTVTLDGLTITNGGFSLDRFEGPPFTAFAGGGILSFEKLDASRLIFRANRMSIGSAVALVSLTADGSVFDDISFEGNFSGTSAQFFTNRTNDITIRNSTFDGGGAQQSGIARFELANGVLFENCTLSNLSTARGGGGVFTLDSDDVIFRGCTFDNLTSARGGAVWLLQGDDFDTFPMDEDDFVFDNCTITNCSSTGRGGGITADNTNIKLINSSVTDNTSAGIGGAMYHVTGDARTYTQVIEKTAFNNNTDGGAGGGICLLVFGTSSVAGTVTNSTLSGNTTPGQGSAVYLQGNSNFNFSDCVVTNNAGAESIVSSGSGVAQLSVRKTRFEGNAAGGIFTRSVVNVDIKNTNFINNGISDEAFQGGAMTSYFLDDIAGIKGMTVDSCEFIGNVVGDSGTFLSGGAAIYTLGGEKNQVPVNITNSLFQANAAADGRSAGAIYMLGAFDLNIDNTDFFENSAGGEGGAIALSRGIYSRDTTEAGIITTNVENFDASISNSRFYNQVAGSQGGAISTQRVGVDLTNCAFVLNLVGTDGAGGGAIIFNGSPSSVDMDNNLEENGGSFTQESVLIHNTFVDNQKGGTAAAVGDHIAVFQPGAVNAPDSNSFKITLLNNAFVLTSGGASFEAEPDGGSEMLPLVPIGNIIFESLGGNFFSGFNGVEFQADDDDTVEEDDATPATDLFVDPDANVGDFPDVDLLITDPVTDNPLINTALTSALVPDEDIRGNPRGEAPDIGAFEAEWGLVDTDEPIENSSLKLDFFPNPTANVLNIRNDDPTILKYDVLVADQLGRVLKATRFGGGNGRIDMTNLPAGIYNLRLMVNGTIYSKQVVKQ